MTDMCDSEDFWIYLVEESIALDWREAYVPLDRLPVNVAIALAERLNMEIQIDSTEYVFHQPGQHKPSSTHNTILH